MIEGSGVSRKTLLSAPFVICVGVLAAAAVGKEMLVRWAGGTMHKEPVPLRKPFHELDRKRLGDYEVVAVKPMTSAMENALGTKEYLTWLLEDTTVRSRIDPRRYADLIVTYYTGTQDPVPHTAEVCFLGAGYTPKQGHEIRSFELPGVGEVPLRVCTFVKTAIFNKEEPTVVYTFHANGEFSASRDSVRKTTTNLLNRHAYFSKVEVSFGVAQCQPRNLQREASVEAAAKLLKVVLPILLEEHWPDWETIERSGLPSQPGGE